MEFDLTFWMRGLKAFKNIFESTVDFKNLKLYIHHNHNRQNQATDEELFDQISEECSKNVTKSYSTSFSLATKMLSSNIRQDIYNIYGFVRFADEIVDTFHGYNINNSLKI